MASKVKFQGHAQGRGFRKIDPGYQALIEQEKHDARIIKNRRAQLKDLVNTNEEVEQNMLAIQKNEEQNLKDITAIEDRAYETRKEALNRNANILEKNKNARLNQLRNNPNIKSLANLSTTLAEFLVKSEKEKLKIEQEARYQQGLLQPTIKPKVTEAHLQGEAALIQNSIEIEDQTKKLADNGVPIEEWSRLKASDSSLDYFELKGKAYRAGQDYASWAESILIRNGITGAAAKEAALAKLKPIYIKANGLWGFKAVFLSQMLEDMQRADNIILKTAQINDARIEVNTDEEKAKNNLITNFTTENVLLYLIKASNTVDNNNLPIGHIGAVANIFTIIEENITTVDANTAYEVLGNIKSTDQNSLFKDRFKARFAESLRKRGRNESAYELSLKGLELADAKAAEEKARKILETTPWEEITPKVFKLIVQAVEAAGGDSKNIKGFYYEQTVAGKYAAVWDKYLGNLNADKGIFPSDLVSYRIPRDIVKKYEEIAKNNQKRFLQCL